MTQIFALVGPNAGKSGIWGGFKFVNGKCNVPDTESARNLLSSFYSAHPEAEFKERQVAYEAEQASLTEAPVSETTLNTEEAAPQTGRRRNRG